VKLVERIHSPSIHPQGKRVLCYSEAWGQGGIETFLMNLFRRLQGKGFAFTLFSTWDWNDKLDSELSSLGIDRWTRFPDQKPSQAIRLKEGPAAFGELIECASFDAVYVNTMNGMGFLWSEEARRRGVPVRIVHSHNSSFSSGEAMAKTIGHNLGRLVLGDSATVRLAVSEDAGRYLFGSKPFEVVNNGIDTKRFRFDSAARLRVREQYGIPKDALLFGSVGRIAEAKNPLFQLRVFAEVLKLEPTAFYLLVGDGDLRYQTKELAEELGIINRVIMPGYTTDPAAIYSALDCFLMPSLYEGLAMVCIEAQCSGCPIICSEALPSESRITDAEIQLCLSEGEEAWARQAVLLAKTSRNRTHYSIQVTDAGFDADGTAKRLAQILAC
jgi:glycosyltransferase involved in cell wall biosynthesis